MTRTRKYLIRSAALCTSLLPALALAHPGHGGQISFVAGALHPVGGVDHLAGFIIVGMLAARLGTRFARPMMAALAGLLVAAWTSHSDGWQYAAGFMLTGAGLVAIGVTATRIGALTITAAARRSPTWVAAATPAHRLFSRR